MTRIFLSAKNFSVGPFVLQIKMFAHKGLTGLIFGSINTQDFVSLECNLLQKQVPLNSASFRMEALIPPAAGKIGD